MEFMSTLKNSLLFMVTLGFTSPIVGSVDSKHAKEQQVSRPALAVKKRLPLPAVFLPQKSLKPQLANYRPSLAAIPELSFEPTETVHSAFLPTQTKSEKMALFMQAVHANPVNTKRLYHMAQDQTIRAHMRDAKTFQELQTLKDAQGVGILGHAIDNNDAPFVSLFAQHADDKQRHEAVKYAAQKGRPRTMLALIPKLKCESEEDATLSYFSKQGEIPYAAISATLDLVEIHKKNAAAYKRKLHRQAIAQFDFAKPDAMQLKPQSEIVLNNQNVSIAPPRTRKILARDVQTLVAQKLMVATIDPGLRKAIAEGNEAEVDLLLANGVSVGKDCAISALDLTVHHEQPNVMRKLITRSGYIPKKKQNQLIFAQKKNNQTVPTAAHVDKKSAHEIIRVLKEELPAQTLAANFRLKKALLAQNLPAFIKALKAGANPNILHRNAHLLTGLFNADEIFLKIALSFGLNPYAILTHQGHKAPIARTAIKMNKPNHVQLLFNAGVQAQISANTNASNYVLSTIIREPNTIFLQMLLNPKDRSVQPLSPNLTIHIKNYIDHITHEKIQREVSIVYLTMFNKNLNATQVLLDAGANPNSRPAALQAFDNKNPEYLRMMLNPRTKKAVKLNPNADTDVWGEQRTLLAIAKEWNEHEKAQLLIEAGAIDTKMVDAHASEQAEAQAPKNVQEAAKT
jgi:hypothetical protein